ncbi:MAG TPA: PilZ domain-containing protein [Bryobacteraceae bacterium]|nr:PilZ domain-containing protein [Bryobacteraceae bacterium]
MPTKQSPGTERRTAPREAATGEVRLRQSDLLAGSFAGRLVDIASSGFRARHNRLNLTSGQLVDFEFQGRSGLASVVWTRIVDGQAETGFRILPGAAA